MISCTLLFWSLSHRPCSTFSSPWPQKFCLRIFSFSLQGRADFLFGRDDAASRRRRRRSLDLSFRTKIWQRRGPPGTALIVGVPLQRRSLCFFSVGGAGRKPARYTTITSPRDGGRHPVPRLSGSFTICFFQKADEGREKKNKINEREEKVLQKNEAPVHNHNLNLPAPNERVMTLRPTKRRNQNRGWKS